MATDGGISDAALIHETTPAVGGNRGLATLGFALGGGGEALGQDAYDNGMRVGASTADALAQARDRVQKTQAASSAAAAIRNPAFAQATGIDPATAEVMASRAEMGADPKSIQDIGTEAQKVNLQAMVLRGGDQGRHAAMALAPASGAMHADGPNGSFMDPFSSQYSSDAAPSATNTPVAVTPLQSMLTQSTTQKNQAEAAALPINANANQTRADKAPNTGAGGPGGKLQTGFKWDTETDPNSPDFGNVRTNPDGTYRQIPNGAAGGEGAVQQRYTQRMVNSASGLAKETSNLAKIGFGESTGAQVGTTGHGVMDVVKDNLGKTLSSESSQNYASSMVNVDRQLGMLELAGGVPPGTYTAALARATTNTPGNTSGARMYHAALIRQISEQAAETMAAGSASPQAKQAVYDAVGKIQQSVPFTPNEVIDFGHDGKPGQSFQQFLATRAGGRDKVETFGTPRNAPASTPAAPAGGAGLPPGMTLVN